MENTISQIINGIPGEIATTFLNQAIKPIADRMSSQMYSNSTLVIKAGASALAKTGAAASYGVASGKPVIIPASTDMPSLTGLSIGAGKFNLVCFYVDSSGALSVRMGVEGATAAAARFPNPPEGKALVGFLSITYASAFVGGTTPLDTATTLYFSPTGAFDPTISL